MENIYYLISQSRTEIIYLIVIISIALILYLLKIRSKRYRINLNESMPADLWFYSQLVNIETDSKKAKPKNLLNIFIKYLCMKYSISRKDLKANLFFELVRKREKNDDFISLYGEIWNSIDEMKHSAPNEVVSYVRRIKLIFNRGDFEKWIREQKINKACNDC